MFDSRVNDHSHSHTYNRYAVIPTADKLGIYSSYSGRGIRIAFLDSGFFPHRDFADPSMA